MLASPAAASAPAPAPAAVASRRHKVLLLIPNLQQGGSERQILELLSRLPDRFEPVLCVWNDTVHYKEYLPPGQPRHVLGVDRMGRRGLARLCEVLAAERPDILHSYRDKSNFWARLAVRRVPVPVVLTSCRNRFITLVHALAERWLQRLSDRVLTNSEGVRRELIRRAGVRPDKIQIIHNFVNLDRFHPPTGDERAAARSRYRLADGEIALLLPGRIGKQKNQLGLGLALWLLRRRGALPANVRVLLAGRNRDRFFVAVLPRWLRWLGVDGHVRHLGTVDDMAPLYHAADALVMPSLYEGLPNAVIEAHASGLPAVVSLAANADRLVIPDESGFEVPTWSPSALARAIARMVALPPEERRRMGARGRANIVERFHPDAALEATLALYDRLLAEKGLA